MPKRQQTVEEALEKERDERWLREVSTLLKRSRWLNDWEEDFLEEKAANEDHWTERRARVTQRIRHQTNLVGSIAGHRVTDLITSLMKALADLTDDEEELVVRLYNEKRVYVSWREAIQLVRLAQRYVL